MGFSQLIKTAFVLVLFWTQLATPSTVQAQMLPEPPIFHREQIPSVVNKGTVNTILFCRSKVLWTYTNLGQLIRFDGMHERIYDIAHYSIGGLELQESGDREIVVLRNSEGTHAIGFIKDGQLMRYAEPRIRNPSIGLRYDISYPLYPEQPPMIRHICETDSHQIDGLGPDAFHLVHARAVFTVFDRGSKVYFRYHHLDHPEIRHQYRSRGTWDLQVHEGNAFIVTAKEDLVMILPHGEEFRLALGPFLHSGAKNSREIRLLQQGMIQIGDAVYRIKPAATGIVLDRIISGLQGDKLRWMGVVEEGENYLSFGFEKGLVRWKRSHFRHSRPLEQQLNGSTYSLAPYKDQLLISHGWKWEAAQPWLMPFDPPYFGPLLFVDSTGRVYTQFDDAIQRLEQGKWVPIRELDAEGFRVFLCETPEGIFCATRDRIIQIEGERQWRFPKAGIQTAISGCGVIDDNRLWVCFDKRLYTLDVSKQEAARAIAVLPSDIRDLLVLGPDSFLLAGYGQGLQLSIRGKVQPLIPEQPEPLLHGHRLLDDGQGYIWVPTNNGLYRFSKQGVLKVMRKQAPALGFHYYGQEDGLVQLEFNGGSTSAGLLWHPDLMVLPDLNGLTYFDPGFALREATAKLPNLEVAVDGHSSFMLLDTNHTIELSQDFHQLLLQFSCVNHGNPQNAFALYRRRGSWKRLPTGQPIDLSHLRHGEHLIEFLVPSSTSSLIPVQLRLRIAPYWYQRKSSILLGIVLLIAAIALVIHWRTRRLSIANRALEDEVAGQKSTISKQQSSLQHYVERLEASQAQLMNEVVLRERMLGMISHDVLGKLRHMRDLSSSMVQEQDPELNRSLIPTLASTSSRVYRYIENALQWAKMKRNMVSHESTTINAYALIQELLEDLRLHPRAAELQFTNDLPKDAPLHTDRQLLYSILSNLLENQLKYSKEHSRIHIGHKKGLMHPHLWIRNLDSPLENIQQLNRFLDPAIPETPLQVSLDKGMGFILIRELLEALGARLQLMDQPPGHAYLLRFPDQTNN